MTKKAKIQTKRIKHTAFQLERLKELQEGLAKDSRPPVYRKDNAIYLYASSAGKCPRALWYYLYEPAKAISRVSSALHITAAMGTDLHKRVQEILGKSKLQLFGIEERGKLEITPGLIFTMKKDGHFETPEGRILFEMKTLSSTQFAFLKGKPIDEKYFAQAQVSMAAFGAIRTEFLFVKRSGTKVATQLDKEEPVFFMRALEFDQSYVDKLRDKLAFLLKEDIPERLPTENFGKFEVSPFDCSYCPFLFHCRPKAQAGYVKKVQGEERLYLESSSKWDKLVVIEPIGEIS